jgi:predicted MFS family arabinose efflux permease
VVNSVEVPLILGPFAAGAAVTGLVLAGGTASQVLGSVLAPRAGSARLGRLYGPALAVMGVGMVTCGVTPTLALVVLAFVLCGVANGLALVHNRSALQRGTEPGERMAVIALLIGVGAIGTMLGAAGGGVLASVASPRAAFVAAGVVAISAAVPALVLSRRSRAAAEGSVRPALRAAGT